MQRLKAFLLKPSTILSVYIILAIAISIQLLSLGKTTFFNPVEKELIGRYYTHYNNYIIFKTSFFNLIDGNDLYARYWDKQWDLYKYSPTFALAMGLLAWLPDYIGLCLWNLLNAVSLYLAIRMLPIGDKSKAGILWFVLLELLTALQSSQSNALLAAMMIGAFAFMERRKPVWATLLLVGAAFIKVYGAIGFVLFFFYPDKVKFIVWSAVWTIVAMAAPLVVTPASTLIAQYESWLNMMAMDHSKSYGISVMGWLHSWFGLSRGKDIVILTGIVLFFAPLINIKSYKHLMYRLLFLAFMLVWVIIFNHKAESSTFIIAIAGVAIWYFSHSKHPLWQIIMLIIVFIFSCLSPTDVFPPFIRQQVLAPYNVKVVPCIIVWVLLLMQLIIYNPDHTAGSATELQAKL